VTTGRLLFFVFLLVLSVVLAFIYYNNFYYHEIAAQDLAHAYTKDVVTADKEFLDKRLNLMGQVKSYYTLPDLRPVLELKTYPGDLSLICFVTDEEDRYTAGRLKEDQNVTVKGKCIGTNVDTLINGVKFDAINITPQ
jgi:hypothetical protein